MEHQKRNSKEEVKALKALILVGGFGTRLRPLTLSKAKPLVEFINKPILCHQIEALKLVGVDEIVLAINYQPERMYDFIKEAEKTYDVKITCSKEEEPLGTAGPIGLAKKYLEKSEGEEIFIFNADITCRFPLNEMLKFHRSHGKEGTIAVTKVKDPSKYGVIISNKEYQITNFIEKPQEFVGDNINSGLYIFNKKFLARVNAEPSSLEREVFPMMAQEGELYTFPLEGFWADVGQPKDYLYGTNLYLNDLAITNSSLLAKGKNILGNVIIHPTAEISENCLIGPNSVIGPGVVVKTGARIKNSVIMDKVLVRENSYIDGSIIGWRSKIGKWARLEGLSILGEEVIVSDELYLNSICVLPNVAVKNSVTNPGTILLS